MGINENPNIDIERDTEGLKPPKKLEIPKEVGGSKNDSFYDEFKEYILDMADDMGVDIFDENIEKDYIGLFYYQLNGFLEINPLFRDLESTNFNELEWEAEAIRWIVDNLNGLPPLKEDETLYRGSGEEGPFKVGDTYKSKGFLSTSRDKKIAEMFAGIREDSDPEDFGKIFVINTKANGGGRHLNKGEDVEKEILFNHNQEFVITKVEIINGVEYIYMDEII